MTIEKQVDAAEAEARQRMADAIGAWLPLRRAQVALNDAADAAGVHARLLPSAEETLQLIHASRKG